MRLPHLLRDWGAGVALPPVSTLRPVQPANFSAAGVITPAFACTNTSFENGDWEAGQALPPQCRLVFPILVKRSGIDGLLAVEGLPMKVNIHTRRHIFLRSIHP